MTETRAPRFGRLSGYARAGRTLLWKLLLWFVIGSAVIVSLGRLLAPYADHARPVVEGLLSQALNQPVQIGHIEAQWPRLSPQIQLNDLTVGTPEIAILQVDRARLEFKLYNLVRPAHNSFELIALGLNLGLIEDGEGRWSWQIEGGGELRGGWQRGLSAGDLKLRSSVVRIVPNGFSPLIWDVPEAGLNRLGERLRIRFTALERFGLTAHDSNTNSDAEELELQAPISPAPLDVQMQLQLNDQGLQNMQAYLQNDRSSLPVRLVQQFAQMTGRTLQLSQLEQIETTNKIWLDWDKNQPFRLHAQTAVLDSSDTSVTNIRIDGYWQPGDWAMQINTLADDPSQALVQNLAFGMRDGRMGLAADRVDLQGLHQALSSLLGELNVWPSQLQGQLLALEAGWYADFTPFILDGQIQAFAVAFGQVTFGLSGLDIALGLSGDHYHLKASGQPNLDWDFLYDRTVPIDQFDAELEISSTGIQVRRLKLANTLLELSAQGQVLWPSERMPYAGPFIDLAVDISRLGSNQLSQWLPQKGIPAGARRWLDRALISLESGQALTTLHGWPLGWRSYMPPGAVHSVIDFVELDLQYGQNWPRGENLSGRVEFESDSMLAKVVSGSAAGAPLQAPVIRIPALRRAEIELSLASDNASAEQLLKLIQALPLERAQQAMALMQWQGPADAVAEVWLPVKQINNWRLSGEVDLNGVDFTLAEPGFQIDQLMATVPFSREGIGPAVLNGQVDKTSVELDFESKFAPSFELSVASDFPSSALLPSSWRSDWPVLVETLDERIDGRSQWRLELGRSNSLQQEQDKQPLVMQLSSDLNGTDLDFPAPLNKAAESVRPFKFEILFDELMPSYAFQMDDIIDGQLQIAYGFGVSDSGDSNFWQLGLAFGGEPSRLPVAENFLITGQIDELALTDWLGLIGQLSKDFDGLGQAALGTKSGIKESISGWLELDVNQWWLGDTQLGALELALAREGGFWRLNFASEEMTGNIRTPASASSLPVAVARFDHLYWPISAEEKPANKPLMIDPRGLPALQLLVDDFRWGDLYLGQMRLISHAQQDGLEIEQFSLGLDDLQLAGSGRWVYQAADLEYAVRTEARLRLTDGDLGTSLNQAGFKLALERGRAVIELDGYWPGSPLDFGLSQINGDLDLLIDDGVIAEAQPGAGRLLGLVSLGSIPRRLRLDFSDVFGSGFGFDRVAGHFDLENGVARTEDLSITAPAADIKIQGETNLAERVYDQTIRVSPGLGSTLPIIGALTGGPIGAAAGVALEQLLNEPISGLSEIEYRVTGSWEDPLIETIGAQAAPLIEPEPAVAPESNLPDRG